MHNDRILGQRRLAVAAVLGAVLASVGAAQDEVKPPESLKEKASYVMGRDLVKDFQERLVDFDVDQLIAGIRDASAGKASVLSEEDIASVMKAFGSELDDRQRQKMREVADKNMREGREFLKQNALKDGVKQLENGLQYIALETGDGPMPNIGDRVKVHFVGTTLAGKEFESTRVNQQPVVIPVGGIGIRGLVEALLRMNVGSKWRVVIPPDLAYGVAGAPPDIEPNQTLIFEIELFEIVK